MDRVRGILHNSIFEDSSFFSFPSKKKRKESQDKRIKGATHPLRLQLLLQHRLPLMQSAEPVDLVLVLAAHLGVVACRGFVFF